jgi:hypothetical protein
MSNDPYQHIQTFCKEVKSKKLSPYLELIGVLENAKMKEDMGIEQLYRVRQMINMYDVDSFRESIDDDGNLESFVMIYMKDGSRYCIDKTYDEFKKLFKKYNNDN